jgi:hypothetical protein
VSTEPNTHGDGRVHLHVSSNAPHHFSAMPYSLRAKGMTVVTPVRWKELDALDSAAAFDDAACAKRWRALGDLFAKQVAALAKQRLPQARADLAQRMMATSPGPRGHIITAAIAILEDGKPRTTAEALARKLVPAGTKVHYIYAGLAEYLTRMLARGRKPPIVQDALRRYRINEPPDDWPDLVPQPGAGARPGGRGVVRAAGGDPERGAGGVLGGGLRCVLAAGVLGAALRRARGARRRRRRDSWARGLPRRAGVQDREGRREPARSARRRRGFGTPSRVSMRCWWGRRSRMKWSFCRSLLLPYKAVLSKISALTARTEDFFFAGLTKPLSCSANIPRQRREGRSTG